MCTGLHPCFDRTTHGWKGLHWTASGLGGDGPPGPEIPAAAAVEVLRANGGEPDDVDRAELRRQARLTRLRIDEPTGPTALERE